MKKLFCSFLLLPMAALSQNVGIGTLSPLAKLHVNDSSVLFSAPYPFGPFGPTPISGPGSRMLWFADKAAFRAGYVIGANWNTDSIGLLSFATGYDTKASGPDAFAAGYSTVASGAEAFATGTGNQARNTAAFASGSGTIASGLYALSSGAGTIASGNASSTFGNGTRATGDNSTAFGLGIFSKSYGGVAVGVYNDSTNAASANSNNALNRLFQVGNGTSNTVRKNALTVLQNGNTGIGPVVPLAKLHVDSTVLFAANGDVETVPAPPPIAGAGRRMLWYQDKAAFRSGYVTDLSWSKDSIGNYSVGAGKDARAIGLYSVALGNTTRSAGIGAVAAGDRSVAINDATLAMGYKSTASGIYSTALGSVSTASGGASFAVGNFSTASGDFSMSLGFYTISKSYGGAVVGLFNDSTNAPNNFNINPLNRIFQVGNGTADNARSNALTVLQNGKVGVGTTQPNAFLQATAADTTLLQVENTASLNLNTNVGMYFKNGNSFTGAIKTIGQNTTDARMGLFTFAGAQTNLRERISILDGGNVGIGITNPTEKLHVAGNILATGTVTPSDVRYKKNIGAITSPLQKVLAMHGVAYDMRVEEFPQMGFSSNRQVGLLAQDLEKILPEVVYTGSNGYKSVEYTKLVPLLIEAIKEQQQQIDEQRAMNKRILAELEKLKKQ